MRHITTGKLVTPHDALKTLALACADYVDVLTGLKFFHGDLVTHIELHRLGRSIFTNKARGSAVGLLAMSYKRFGSVPFLASTKAQLHGVIPVVVGGLFLQHRAGTRFD